MAQKTKIGVLGLGAIGSVVSLLLEKSQAHELHYYNRSQRASLKVIVQDQKAEHPIEVHTTLTSSPDLDWLVICLKEHQYTQAHNWLQQLIGPHTKVAVIRNGLRHKESVSAYADEEDILECLIDCPSQPVEDGFYHQLRQPIITLPNQPLSQTFKDLFVSDQVQIDLVKDFKTEGWKKLCESAALGAILCLSGETCWIFKDEKLRNLYVDLLEECLLVARADGAQMESNYVDLMLEKLMSYPPTKGSSMLTDRLKGQPIELGAKNGIISDLAKSYNLETPINDLMVQLLSYTNRG